MGVTTHQLREDMNTLHITITLILATSQAQDVMESSIIESVDDDPGPQACTGTLRLVTEEGLEHRVSEDRIVNTLRHPMFGYFPYIVSVAVDGNCCWKVYDRLRHRGRTETFSGAAEGRLSMVVKSVRKIQCTN